MSLTIQALARAARILVPAVARHGVPGLACGPRLAAHADDRRDRHDAADTANRAGLQHSEPQVVDARAARFAGAHSASADGERGGSNATCMMARISAWSRLAYISSPANVSRGRVQAGRCSRWRMRGPCDVGYARSGVWTADIDETSPLSELLGITGARRACMRNPDGVYVEIMEDDRSGPGRSLASRCAR